MRVLSIKSRFSSHFPYAFVLLDELLLLQELLASFPTGAIAMIYVLSDYFTLNKGIKA